MDFPEDVGQVSAVSISMAVSGLLGFFLVVVDFFAGIRCPPCRDRVGWVHLGWVKTDGCVGFDGYRFYFRYACFLSFRGGALRSPKKFSWAGEVEVKRQRGSTPRGPSPRQLVAVRLLPMR